MVCFGVNETAVSFGKYIPCQYKLAQTRADPHYSVFLAYFLCALCMEKKPQTSNAVNFHYAWKKSPKSQMQ